MTDKIDVAGLRALVAKAMPGEWSVNQSTPSVILTRHGRISVSWSVQRAGDANDFGLAEDTAALITAAVNALPALLDAAEATAALEAENARLREALALQMVAVERLAGLISAETPDDEHPSEADSRRYRLASPIFKSLGMSIEGGADRDDPVGWGFDWPAELQEAEKSARAALSERPQ